MSFANVGRGISRWSWAATLLVAVCFAPAANAQTQIASRLDELPPSHPLTSAIKRGHEALAAMEEVSDYEAVFVKKEIIGGELVEQKMQIRFREQPMSVLLKFIEPHDGREVLYIDGRNSNKLQVKDSGLLALVGPVSLDPTSSMAMKETVYPITSIGIRNMLDRLLTHWLEEISSNDVAVQCYPNARMGKQTCEVLEVSHTKQSPQHEYHKVRLYVDKETGRPIRIQQFGFPTKPGSEPPLIGDYAYLNLKTNIGLTDRDFSLGR